MSPIFRFLPNLAAEADQQLLTELLHRIFSDTPAAEWHTDLHYQQQHQPVQAWLAFDGEGLIGCKLGYERKPGHYYSWLGGVHPDHRGQGIAAELMRRQHAWCQEQGYYRIRTQTYNRWRAMLLLNLRHGFDIIGTVQGARGLTIVLEKELSAKN
ncbi:GNAT family N-acetyltransferase [Hymenobacter psychrotolerans]|uniref:Acetyltransferase (GNAT) domain-containing protein n=1 Tax=Hymenobacter psychrotolerans DSM 18569 TaxID=1121959 RepID=A0A1M7CPW1_9BACT|nr:GNAT family N-acetyltransferase [Hymenobacter psychrotolerans]SHL69212.1 Acetyltransferase (GNAT) domain-containing protein [Hymenobacter psychrotolerans DSM 18569]